MSPCLFSVSTFKSKEEFEAAFKSEVTASWKGNGRVEAGLGIGRGYGDLWKHFGRWGTLVCCEWRR